MRQPLVVLSPLLLGALLVWFVWLASDRTRTRYAFLAAALGSILLTYEALLFSLCGTGENTTGSQCHGGADLLVLLGIPVLLFAAWGVSESHGLLPCLLGMAVLVLLFPLALHTT